MGQPAQRQQAAGAEKQVLMVGRPASADMLAVLQISYYETNNSIWRCDGMFRGASLVWNEKSAHRVLLFFFTEAEQRTGQGDGLLCTSGTQSRDRRRARKGRRMRKFKEEEDHLALCTIGLLG